MSKGEWVHIPHSDGAGFYAAWLPPKDRLPRILRPLRHRWQTFRNRRALKGWTQLGYTEE